MLRDRIRSGSRCGRRRCGATMHSGALVSDEVVNELVEERLSEPDAAKGFILDGYPRTLDQAEHLAEWLVGRGIREVVIHLAVDYNIIIARLTGRRQCPRCGTLYNVIFQPPKGGRVCAIWTGRSWLIRDDDQRSRDPGAVGRVRAADAAGAGVFSRTSGHRVIEVDAERRSAGSGVSRRFARRWSQQ